MDSPLLCKFPCIYIIDAFLDHGFKQSLKECQCHQVYVLASDISIITYRNRFYRIPVELIVKFSHLLGKLEVWLYHFYVFTVERRQIDRIGNNFAPQPSNDLSRYCFPYILLGFVRACTQVGGDYDIVKFEERVVNAGFLFKNIYSGTCHMPALQGIIQCFFFDYSAPGVIYKPNAFFHQGYFFLPDHPYGFLRLWSMDGYEIGSLYQFLYILFFFGMVLFETLVAYIRIVCDYLHSKSPHPL